MSHRIPVMFLLGLMAITVACTNKKVSNPLADVGSKQPDKVLFDRAMDAMKHNRYEVARLTLQTLINTYPDSEFIARAKLSLADSWYAEGGSASWAQAESEYKDFITFFPTMPEAAEAQLKIANIHYQQMEKPDRDYTHALRAEEEYRNLILQFPDSKLVPEAKQHLLEVQEVLAEREYRVGRFYYMRESYPAAIARLRSVVDKYPLYSGADETLYLLGQSYEGEISMLRARKVNEAAKSRMIEDFTKQAAAAYSKIITRYPLMQRVDDAKSRLQALHQPVPTPTRAALALNKSEEDSRRENSTFGKLVGNFTKHPDVTQASKVGDPTLVDPTPVSATDVVQQATRVMRGNPSDSGKNALSIEAVGSGAPPPDEPAPRSDTPPDNNATAADSATTPPADAAPASGAGELVPNVAPTPNATPDPNELKPNVPSDGQTLPPPQQVNEISNGDASSSSSTASPTGSKPADAAAANGQTATDDSTISSSKHKKKKGLKKIIPF